MSAAVVCMSFFAFRTATWLLALDVAAALVLTSVGVAGAVRWSQVFLAPLRLTRRLLPGLRFVVDPVAGCSAQRRPQGAGP